MINLVLYKKAYSRLEKIRAVVQAKLERCGCMYVPTSERVNQLAYARFLTEYRKANV
jgi:hypothetical protein